MLIALRGLCLATGRLEVARSILLEWAASVSEGMLPNRFPDQGGAPEYNSVDASLWYVIAVRDFLTAAATRGIEVRDRDVVALRSAVDAILEGYAHVDPLTAKHNEAVPVLVDWINRQLVRKLLE